ncbi:MAG: fumarate hydratase [Lachnospirales bacterium]
MREISVEIIKEEIKKMFIECNWNISEDIYSTIKNTKDTKLARDIMDILVENMNMAKGQKRPICQDTGMAIVYLEVGQDVHLVNGDISTAVNQGVKEAYIDGYLRKSVVSDPLERNNTNDNTPAIIKYNIVKGDKVKISIMAKGFGSENMSGIKMLKPADGVKGVIDFVLEKVKNGGGNPCPPIIVGIGIGGTFDECAYISKKALLRSINSKHANPYYSKLEETLLEKINNTNIGPQGLGGKTTALGVNIEVLPTHIAGLPVAVNVCCHASRHMSVEI